MKLHEIRHKQFFVAVFSPEIYNGMTKKKRCDKDEIF